MPPEHKRWPIMADGQELWQIPRIIVGDAGRGIDTFSSGLDD